VLLKVLLAKLPKVTEGCVKHESLYSCVIFFLKKLARNEFLNYICPDCFLTKGLYR